METLPASRAPLAALTDAVLALVASRHPDAALACLAPLWAASRPGLARRALLAARITLMRQAMTAAPLAVVEPVAEAAAEPVAEPVATAPVFVPAPKAAPLNKGALTLLNLEDAAKMLMAGGDDDVVPEGVPDGMPEGMPDPLRDVAKAELAEAIAFDAAGAADKGRAKRVKPKVGGGAARPGGFDLVAQFADLAGDDGAPEPVVPEFAVAESVVPEPVVAEAEVGAGVAAQTAKAGTAKAGTAAALAADLSAQFAALDED